MANANNGGLPEVNWPHVTTLLIHRGLPRPLVDAYAKYIGALTPEEQAVEMAYPGGSGLNGPQRVQEMQRGTELGIHLAVTFMRGTYAGTPESEQQQLIKGGLDSLIDVLAEKVAQDFSRPLPSN